MLRLVARRLLTLVPILLGLSVVLFAWIRALPGGPAVALLGEEGTPEQVARVRALYRLDRPIWEQYWSFLGRAARLDLGTSIQTGRPVLHELGLRFPATFELAVAALIFAAGVGVPLGYLAARHAGRWLDHAIVSGSLLGISTPIFFVAFLLKYAFAVNWHLLPSAGRQSVRLTTTHPTGLYTFDGLVTGNLGAAWDAIEHLVLPAIALGSISLAVIARITRAAVLDVSNDDYVRTAYAKGLAPSVIRRDYVLRNAQMPIITLIGIHAGVLLSGAVLTEKVFGIPGIGSFLASAIFTRDYPTLQGFILFVAILVVLVNTIVDVAYGLLDPRIRVRG